uniref:MRP-S23 domain-containing protein n=1 Tax=Panagrellus redivivus TaxID=6233 RepID=A0A7E4VDL3_PANRE
MGIFKRVANAATKDIKNANFQWKAVVKQDKIEHGEKVLPPKHARESEHYEKSRNDPELRKKIDARDEELIDKMNKFKITSTDPPERWTSSKDLPTRETEWLHRNDPTWEFGFYEPPLEKMEPNKLMFREALDLLRTRMEATLPGPDGNPRPKADEAAKRYADHPAVKRVDAEKLENMWQYFRPFERKEKVRVIDKKDLLELEAVLEGKENYKMLTDQEVEALQFRRDLSQKSPAAQAFLQMTKEEQDEFLAAAREARIAEKERLESRLAEMKLLQDEVEKEDKDGKK